MDIDYFRKAMLVLRPQTQYVRHGNSVATEEEFNNAVTAYKAEYDTQEYARKRQAEFPSIQDLVVALYDTDDKADIEAKRAEVKKKYPKP